MTTFLGYIGLVVVLAVTVSLVLGDRPSRAQRGAFAEAEKPQPERPIRFRYGGFREPKRPRNKEAHLRTRTRRQARARGAEWRAAMRVFSDGHTPAVAKAIRIVGGEVMPEPGDMVRLTKNGTNHYLRLHQPNKTMCDQRAEKTLPPKWGNGFCNQCSVVVDAWNATKTGAE